MRRREFLGVLGGAAALSFPRRGNAQTQTSLPLVGVLLPQVKWPNDIIGHSRLLQQNRRFSDIAGLAANVRF
jgi:hypothetical protein